MVCEVCVVGLSDIVCLAVDWKGVGVIGCVGRGL